jgi:hypothetical protein
LIVLPLSWAERTFSSALSFLGKSEDNGEWLQYLAGTLENQNGKILGPFLQFEGIPGLSTINALLQGMQDLATNRQFVYLDNVLVLVHGYGLILTLVVASFVSFAVSALARRGCNALTIFATTVLISVVVYEICGTILTLGHYPFLYCLWFMSLGLMSSETLVSSRLKRFTPLLSISLVLGAALFWQHITVVSVSVSVLLMAERENISAVSKLASRSSMRTRLLVLCGSTIFLIPIYTFFWPQFRRVVDFAYIRKMLVIDGGVASVTNLFAFTVILSVVLFVLEKNSTWPKRIISYYFFSFLFYLLVIQVASRSIEPYTLHYAYQKTFVLFIYIFIPWSILFVVTSIKVNANYFGAALACLLIFVVLGQEGQINGTFRYPRVLRQSQNSWASAATTEILNDPSRSVLCLNTSDESKFTDFHAYECNRLLNGLQGNTYDVRFDSWSPLGIWESPIDVLLELPDSFFSEVTLLVSDELSRQRGDEVIQKVIESIPWGVVKVVELSIE